MWITNYNFIPIWAYGLNVEDLNSVERVEMEYKDWEEVDLLTDFDFLMEDFKNY